MENISHSPDQRDYYHWSKEFYEEYNYHSGHVSSGSVEMSAGILRHLDLPPTDNVTDSERFKNFIYLTQVSVLSSNLSEYMYLTHVSMLSTI